MTEKVIESHASKEVIGMVFKYGSGSSGGSGEEGPGVDRVDYYLAHRYIEGKRGGPPVRGVVNRVR